jgi:hypothetical protein
MGSVVNYVGAKVVIFCELAKNNVRKKDVLDYNKPQPCS